MHFFNSVGVSILTQRHQDERIAALEAENAELKRRLESAVRRLREVIGDADNEMRN